VDNLQRSLSKDLSLMFVTREWVCLQNLIGSGEECVMFPEAGCDCIFHQKSSKALLRFFEIHCFVFAF
jgi:hypothetical protein